MAQLVSNGKTIANLEIADSARTRLRGLLGRDHVDGALIIKPAKSIHTLGMRIPIDIAFCDHKLRIIDVVTMKPWRIGWPRWRSKLVIEAEAGSFTRWGIHAGHQLEITS